MDLRDLEEKLNALNVTGYNVKHCNICEAILYSIHDTCSICFKTKCDENKCHAAGVAVFTFIDKQKYVLMGRCSKKSNEGRQWHLEFIGGVASDADEAPEEIAVRELREETLETIDLQNQPLELLGGHNNATGNGYILYGCTLPFKQLQSALQRFEATAKHQTDLEIDMLVLVNCSELRRVPRGRKAMVNTYRYDHTTTKMPINAYAATLVQYLTPRYQSAY